MKALSLSTALAGLLGLCVMGSGPTYAQETAPPRDTTVQRSNDFDYGWLGLLGLIGLAGLMRKRDHAHDRHVNAPNRGAAV